MPSECATVDIVITVKLDSAYLRAVGQEPERSAKLICDEIAQIIFHEDWGSTVPQASMHGYFREPGVVNAPLFSQTK